MIGLTMCEAVDTVWGGHGLLGRSSKRVAVEITTFSAVWRLNRFEFPAEAHGVPVCHRKD
ncbi:MAG: hypothetical protein QXT33_05485 [Thermofilum sp.]